MAQDESVPPTPARADLARALGRIPSGLFVVTVLEPASRLEERAPAETAFLASWVMQAGFEPPMLSVAVGEDRPARPWMESPGTVFGVSILGEDEKGRLGPFARGVEPAVGALDGFEIERTASGLAVVRACLAWLECRCRAHLSSGDHRIVLGEIVGGRAHRDAAPAVHVRTDGLRY